MIVDILFSWNELTITMASWLGIVSLALVVDFAPDIYRERKARARLEEAVELLLIAKTEEAKMQAFDPDQTFKLGVYKIEKPMPARRRHAKV